MVQNNTIIDKLLTNNQKTKSAKPQIESSQVIDDQSHVLITAYRVEGIRYKVYSLIIFLIWIYCVINYLKPAFEKYQDTRENLIKIETKTSIFDARERKYKQDRWFITKIDKQEKEIISYFNNKKAIEKLDPDIQEHINVVRNYLQITPIESNKMRVDEKIILANINEYLLRSEEKTRNGQINKIEIGDSEIFSSTWIIQLPIIINVTFDNKNWLLSFINNIEQKILPDSNFRILYKINEINYDIVNYREEQEVDIYLTAYFLE